MFPLKLLRIKPLCRYKIGRSLISRKKDTKKTKKKQKKTKILTQAKLSFAPLAIQHKTIKKNKNVKKIRSIIMNKFSFEPKTCQDNRTRKEHRNIIYQAVTNNLAKTFEPKKKHQDLRFMKSPSHSKHSKPLFARLMKQYQTTKPI